MFVNVVIDSKYFSNLGMSECKWMNISNMIFLLFFTLIRRP